MVARAVVREWRAGLSGPAAAALSTHDLEALVRALEGEALLVPVTPELRTVLEHDAAMLGWSVERLASGALAGTLIHDEAEAA